MAIDLNGRRALIVGAADDFLMAIGETVRAAGAVVTVQASDAPLEAPSGIDALIVHAGWRRHLAFLDHTPDEWDAALAANFETPVYLAQAAARAMIARGVGGRLVFLGGVEGVMPFAGTAAAGTTLTMLHTIARMMAVDLAPHRITVNVIAVGYAAGEAAQLAPDVQAHLTAGTPTGRLTTAADVGAAVAYLLSDAAANVTGTITAIDGGYTLTRAAGRGMVMG